MPTLAEALGPQPQVPQQSTQLHDALAAGADVLSGDQTVSFTPYVRTVLPLDNWIFWLNAALLSPVQLAQNGLQSAEPVAVPGSLHYASVGVQEEDQSIVVRKVDFSAMGPIQTLAEATTNVLWVATWQVEFLGSFRFAISSQSAYYEEAGVRHLVGDAVYPAFETQLIDTLAGFAQRQVVSNSLPIWLALQTQVPFPSLVVSGVALYPAWLVPNNLTPPYGAVEVLPGGTRALQPTPLLDQLGNHWQLMSDRVRFSLYGLGNDDVMDFLDYIIQASELTGLYGLMDMPVVRDEHRPQVELATLAQKKTVETTVSYYQLRARDVARQLIETAVPSITWSLTLPPAPQPPIYNS